MTDLQNAIALVTGASRGLGRAIAVGLAEIGVDVVVNYRAREDEAQACADEIRRRARRAAVVRSDVSRVDEARRLVREAEAALGRFKRRPKEACRELSDHVGDALLGIRLSRACWLRGQLKHCRRLTLAQVRQQHGPPVRKFERIVMCGKLVLVNLSKDCRLVVDCLCLPSE